MAPTLKRKSNFTLLEILICFAFVSLILLVLFTHFRSTSLLSVKTEQVKKAALAREHAYERLSTLFAKVASSEQQVLASKESCFFTESPSEKSPAKILYFAFDPEADPEKDFSSLLRVKLFLDEAKNLSLEISPLKREKEQYARKEILLSQVDDLHFAFYKKPDDQSKASSLEDFIKVDSYALTEKSLPCFFKISLTLTGNDAPLEFSFFLCKIIEPIRYET